MYGRPERPEFDWRRNRSTVDTGERIPNNVALGDDKKLQRALERAAELHQLVEGDGPFASKKTRSSFRPTGDQRRPRGLGELLVRKMPDYRWALPRRPSQGSARSRARRFRKARMAAGAGRASKHAAPFIVTQGDTEPASVEQQRMLGHSCPSVYDLRISFNKREEAVTSGRWSTCSTRTSVATDARKPRRSSSAAAAIRQAAHPRRVQRAVHRLALVLHVHVLHDRDGKYQLLSLAESAFDPLSRSTRFMLTEEAHHMFVGETGVQARRRAHMRSKMAEKKVESIDQVRALGLIDCRRCRSTSTFGSRFRSTCSAVRSRRTRRRISPTGIKGRAKEATYEDHIALNRDVQSRRSGSASSQRDERKCSVDEYVEDCQRGVDKWNRTIAQPGHSVPIRLARPAFSSARRPQRERHVRSSRQRDQQTNSKNAATSGSRTTRTRRT